MAETQQAPEELELTPAPQPSGPSRDTMAMLMGAAIGFGLGMVFALGGFWAGLLCLLFTVVGAIVGRILSSL